jgi:serine/threonine-protein kinase
MKKNYTISFSASRLFKVYLPILLVVMVVGFVVGVVLVDRLIMPRIVGVSDKGTITVPSVLHLSLEEARTKLYKAGLRTQVSSSQYDSELPSGTILSQQPQADETVKKSRLINVVVSKGPEADTVEMNKLNELQARNSLRKQGFSRVKINKIYDEEVEKDLVVRSAPPSGTVVSREMPVEVFISKGSQPTHAVVPNIIGDMLSEAQSKIEESGLTIGKIGYERGGSSPGTVMRQSVAPGSNIPLESRVDLTIAAQ